MNKLYYIILLAFLASCSKQPTRIEWINSQEIIDYNSFVFVLQSKPSNAISKVYLYSTLQATELNVRQKGNLIIASIHNDKKILNGSARLVVIDKNEKDTSFRLIGKTVSQTEINDFRSPKTLITDSSLSQQQLIYTVNETRNLIRSFKKMINNPAPPNANAILCNTPNIRKSEMCL